jgi:hypothetical protein
MSDLTAHDRAVAAAATLAALCNARHPYSRDGWTNFALSRCPLTGQQFEEYKPSARITIAPDPGNGILYLSPEWLGGNRIAQLVDHLRRSGCDLSRYDAYRESVERDVKRAEKAAWGFAWGGGPAWVN